MVDRAKDERFMRMALQEAKEAFDADEIPVGAVIVCKDRVVARAHNLTECLGDVTAHAEMQAITSAAASLGGKYLTDCTLYVTLEPCVMCAGAIGGLSSLGSYLEPAMRNEVTGVSLSYCILNRGRVWCLPGSVSL